MPASAGRRDGRLVRNCQLRRPQPSAEHVVEQRAQRDQREHHDDNGHRLKQDIAHQTAQKQRADCAARLGGTLDHAYSSRNRRRRRLLARLRTNVITNSSMPTAKIVRYSMRACGRVAEADLNDIARSSSRWAPADWPSDAAAGLPQPPRSSSRRSRETRRG